jgi:hypothetical protein
VVFGIYQTIITPAAAMPNIKNVFQGAALAFFAFTGLFVTLFQPQFLLVLG